MQRRLLQQSQWQLSPAIPALLFQFEQTVFTTSETPGGGSACVVGVIKDNKRIAINAIDWCDLPYPKALTQTRFVYGGLIG